MATQRQNRAKLAAFEADVSSIVDEAVEALAKYVRNSPGQFRLTDPVIRKEIDVILQRFNARFNTYLRNRVIQRWHNSEAEQKELIERIGKRAGLTNAQIQAFAARQPAQLSEYLNRRIGGKTLSDRVWDMIKALGKEFEHVINRSIQEGIPARDVAKNLKQYLKEPNRAFRRARGPDGKLRLSKAAEAYNPGRGVYRSSYKNAFRLARTETNNAFRAAAYEKYQTLDFVVGIRIRLSNNPNHCDMCEALQGDYPKDFRFSGWHPQCRCQQEAILRADSELFRQGESRNAVKEPPEAFQRFVKENPDKVRQTYFGIDNPQYL